MPYGLKIACSILGLLCFPVFGEREGSITASTLDYLVTALFSLSLIFLPWIKIRRKK